DKNMTISVISDPTPTEKGVIGIPPEYENIIFEPFFRMVSGVFEKYGTIDFGLGLTRVEKIFGKHNGRAAAGNINDSSDFSREPVIKVEFSIQIPLETVS
ncbi:MAG: hypothetical protein GY754_01930, partial [bacterium]|nr:hypothetical protein [bacterium]